MRWQHPPNTPYFMLCIEASEKGTKTILFTSKKTKMAKSSLTKAELAALDFLIADLQGDNGVVDSVNSDASFITGITRITVQVIKTVVRVTPIIAEAVGGASVLKDAEIKQLSGEAKDGLSLDKLIELRKQFN